MSRTLEHKDEKKEISNAIETERKLTKKQFHFYINISTEKFVKEIIINPLITVPLGDFQICLIAIPDASSDVFNNFLQKYLIGVTILL